jgi:hypothetical protein
MKTVAWAVRHPHYALCWYLTGYCWSHWFNFGGDQVSP